MKIHPTAIISSDATIAEGVEIGPYSIIGPDVHIGRNTIIGPHVVIETRADIGEENRISQFASIGGDPQDLKYRGEPTRVVIGNRNSEHRKALESMEGERTIVDLARVPIKAKPGLEYHGLSW